MQIRVTENEAPDTARPLLRRVVLAAKNSRIVCEEPFAASDDVRVSAPCYSQMVRQPEISHVICSATTIAMLLNQKGENVLPEEIALHNYDSAYDGCGNWLSPRRLLPAMVMMPTSAMLRWTILSKSCAAATPLA